jgi:hypothetical protein
MERETLSHYGWIVVCLLIVSVMIAFATPFGEYMKSAANGVLGGIGDANENALSEENRNNIINNWENEFLYNTEDVESLKTKHEFGYYTSIQDALNGENGTTESNGTFGVYYDDGVLNIVLLKNATIGSITVNKKTAINLAGHTLTLTASPGITVNSNLTIDGAIEGSKIISSQTGTQGKIAHVNESGKLTLNKGTYTSKVESVTTSSAFTVDGTMIANSAEITTNNPEGKVFGIEMSSTASVDLDKTSILATSISGRAYGVSGSGKLEASESNFIAYSNFGESNDQGYTSMSSGISASGKITLTNCTAYGTHSGVSCSGYAVIDGGDYSGYNCGGIYVSGPNSTNYIKNANFSEGAMPEGYVDESGGNNKAAMYIGGNVGRDNITVYVDKCTFTGAKQPIVLRGTSGEKNNTLYISNSSINLNYTSTGIRIDNDTMSVFIGDGNNFGVENTSRQARVTVTTETYTK